jgi:cyclopropane fatty-acyl-phospholipid synthase-like methyltransferase
VVTPGVNGGTPSWYNGVTMRPANDPSINYKDLVRDTYNDLALDYDDLRQVPVPSEVARLARVLEPGTAVLDIGCGAGIPITKYLSAKFTVTGVDVSEGMLERARRNVPGATFINTDIMATELPREHFGAVTAFYTIFHLPREQHPALLRRIHTWLVPGGFLLATLSFTDEPAYTDDCLGRTMFWSNYGLDEYRGILVETGFTILEETALGSGYRKPNLSPNERHPLILARKE